jgi:hypothetical protein
LLLMRPDGSHSQWLTLWPHCDSGVESFDRRWDWDPSGKAVYVLTTDSPFQSRSRDRLGRRRLVRYLLPGGAVNDVWDPGSAIQLPGGYDWWTGYVSVSPDGRSVAVAFVAVPYQSTQQGRRPMLEWDDSAIVFAFLVPTDGEQPFLLSRAAVRANLLTGSQPLPTSNDLDFVWSKDGKRLYYWTEPAGRSGTPELHVWKRGEREAAVLQWFGAHGAAASPENSDLLVRGDDVLLVDNHGSVRTYLNAGVRDLFQKGYRLLGLDAHGRAVVCSETESTMLGTVDLDTGELKNIYP